MEARGDRPHPLQLQRRGRFRPLILHAMLSLSVISVGRESQTNASRIALLRGGKVLRKAREPAEKQRQNPSGHGVQRAQMADGLLSRDAAQPVHHIVAGHPARLIDHKKSVHIITLVALGTLAN